MKLGLGTVQLGLPYGVTNRRGQPPAEEALRVLETAAECGIDLLDIAPAYGAAEALVGDALRAGLKFRIVTKTVTGAVSPAALRETFHRSLERMGAARVHGLLLHHCADALAPGGEALIQEMQALQRDGLTERIGVSVYEAEELEAVLDVFTPDIVQLPVSVINQSLIASGHLARLGSMGIEVHARSIFLQGVLLESPAELPSELVPLHGKIAAFHALMRATGISSLEGALAFIAQQPEISVAIVGVTGREELLQVVAAAAACETINLDFRAFASNDDLRDPAKWENARSRAAGATP